MIVFLKAVIKIMLKYIQVDDNYVKYAKKFQSEPHNGFHIENGEMILVNFHI